MFGAGYYLGRRSHGGDYGYSDYGLGGRYQYAYPWYGGYSGYGIGLGYGYGSGYGIGLGYGYGSSYGYGGYGSGYLYPSYGYSTYYYLPRGSSGYDDSGTVIVDGDYVDVDVNGSGSVYAAPDGSSSGYVPPPGSSSCYAIPGDASSDYPVPSGPVPVDETPPALPPVEQSVPDSVPDSEIPANVGRGIDAFSAGRYDDARAWFLRAVLADTGDPYAKLLLGLAHFANGDFDASAIAVRRALTTSPRLMADPIDLRIFYRDPAMFDEQLKRLVPYALARSGAGSDDHGGDVRWLLSYLYFATGNPDESLAVLDRIGAAGSEDALVSTLRDAVARVLSNRARAIAPSRPPK